MRYFVLKTLRYALCTLHFAVWKGELACRADIVSRQGDRDCAAASRDPPLMLMMIDIMKIMVRRVLITVRRVMRMLITSRGMMMMVQSQEQTLFLVFRPTLLLWSSFLVFGSKLLLWRLQCQPHSWSSRLHPDVKNNDHHIDQHHHHHDGHDDQQCVSKKD